LARPTVFISHITEEKELARKLKSFLRHVFGSELPVFVSSDYSSIPGGSQWFSEIVDGVKSASVVLVLISVDSVDRRWVNFEAGVGLGTGARVIPLVVRSFPKSEVPFPMAGLQLRDTHDPMDVAALVVELGGTLRIATKQFDAALFVEEFIELERAIPRETISLEPVIETRTHGRLLSFDIVNTGERGLELIELRVSWPVAVKNPNWELFPVPPALTVEREDASDGPRVRGRLLPGLPSPPGSGYYRADFQVLPQIITRGMSPFRVRALDFLIKEHLTPEEKRAQIMYGLSAKGADLSDSKAIGEIRDLSA